MDRKSQVGKRERERLKEQERSLSLVDVCWPKGRSGESRLARKGEEEQSAKECGF